MQGKILSKAENGKMVQIGTDIRTGRWFYFDKVKADVDAINRGEDITYAYIKKGNWFNLTFITKGLVDLPEAFKANDGVGEGATVSSGVSTASTPPKETSTPTPRIPPSTQNSTTASIERQVAFKGAIEIVGKMDMTGMGQAQIEALVKDLTEKFVLIIRY
jgi:hypothetical protein